MKCFQVGAGVLLLDHLEDMRLLSDLLSQGAAREGQSEGSGSGNGVVTSLEDVKRGNCRIIGIILYNHHLIIDITTLK